MDQKLVTIEGSLTDAERLMSVEERNSIIAEEITNFGFIRDYRLADKTSVPKRESIIIEYCEGVIRFTELPEKFGILVMIKQDDGLSIFSEDLPGIEREYSDQDIIKIKDAAVGVDINLNSSSKDPRRFGLDGKGRVFFTNTIASSLYFHELEFSIIDVELLRDGYVLIDLINTRCSSISFSRSRYFENAFDVRVNSEPKEGEIYIANVKSVKNRMIIYHPALRMALSSQATVGVVDQDKGIYYAHVMFYFIPEAFGNTFVDMDKIMNKSSHINNVLFFRNTLEL